MAAGGLVLVQLAREDLEPRLAAWIGVSYYAAGIVIGPALENFHDLCAIPLLSFSLLLGVREDVGLLSFSFGLWMLLRCQGRWRWAGAGLCLYSLVMVAAITNLVMPLFGTEVADRFMEERFGQFLAAQGGRGSTLDVLRAMASQPLLLVQELLQPPGATLKFLLTLWLPLALLPAAGVDGWLLMAGPLFVALSSQGGNALAVTLRFVLYLVPGVFAGGILWWRTRQALFHERWLKRLWRSALVLSILFTITANPHRSLSALIPDSIHPWVYIPPVQQLQRGLEARALLSSIPSGSSVAAETQLIPLLAQRRVLLRFPESTEYTDDQEQRQAVDWIVSQPSFNADYAPAFRRNERWVRRGEAHIQELLNGGLYTVHRCDQRGIVLRHLDAQAVGTDEPSQEEGRACITRQFEQARQQLQQQRNASSR